MTASQFPSLFRLWILPSLKTSPDRLHFVPLFSKLFSLCKLVLPFSLFYCPTSVQDYFQWSLIPRLGPVPHLVSVLGTSSFLLCPFGFEILLGSRACPVGGSAFPLISRSSLLNPTYLHGSWSLLCSAHRE